VLQGQWLFVLGPERPLAWLWHPAFLVGAGLYLAGVLVNRRADATLRALRAPGESGYRVPRGGLFDYVSCPNYLGEIIQWIGWAVATWSFAGLAFALWTTANLLPRALAHHRWYRSHFPDYPQQRRALLPFVL
jgi:3-oxo-5-alpha-steroid 4-dehydrogenase 1